MWNGNARRALIMRITDACRQPIGIGLVSAKLWNNGLRNTVESNAFGPHSIGLLIKDRRVYVHHRDELVQWKPLGRMPPIPKNVDLMMRVSQGKVSFFYQGIPVVLPIVSDLTLRAEERVAVGATGTLVALDALRQLVTIDVNGEHAQCPLMCVEKLVSHKNPSVAPGIGSTGFEPARPM